MWRKLPKPLLIVLASMTIALALLYIAYRLVDPLPPHHFTIAAGAAGSGYDTLSREYARILAPHGVALEVRNSAGAGGDLDLLRDNTSGVQAALAPLRPTPPRDP